MKERLEELLAWKERQVLEKELLEGKRMEAMRQVEALTKINEEQQVEEPHRSPIHSQIPSSNTPFTFMRVRGGISLQMRQFTNKT